jgi:ATP-dependent DNA helicase RecG
MVLRDSLDTVKGIGTQTAALFAKVGVRTIDNLLAYLPRSYQDYSQLLPITKLRPGIVSFEAVITQSAGRYVRRGMHITEAIATDPTGSVRIVWFNQPYRAAALKSGESYYVCGEYKLSRQRMSVLNPSIEKVSDFPAHTARIVPIYKESKGIKSHQVRRTIQRVIDVVKDVPENLPDWLVKNHALMPRHEALLQMHFPDSSKRLLQAKRRIGFEEVFELTLASLLNKYELLQDEALVIPFDERIAKEFVKHLPFTLTDAQRKTIWQIYLDMQKSTAMSRLAEGDVGSGKTVVAAMAAAMAMNNGFDVALMAPTEILAKQHAETLHELLRPLGLEGSLLLLVGGMTSAQKKIAKERAAHHEPSLLVGTHALIEHDVNLHKLGLVIFDEQHRFGVEQRKALMKKAGHAPHVLSLTATPIPRSLALTLFGEMDISIIDTKPAGRLPISTQLISPNSRASLYKKVEAELRAGRQAFVVCPLVEDSRVIKARSVESVYKDVQQKFLPNWRIGLLHGRMKPVEKDKIMSKFAAHKLDVLVSTTVIEVGVNVQNASVMVIESADRFGLAQIHQLRGRVGRSVDQGYCYLVMTDSAAPSKRMRAIASSQNGFELAELDLELRGPGAIYGTLQHGVLDLKVAKLTDVKLIAEARTAAQEFINKKENLLQYTQLHERVQALRAITNLN